MAVQLGFPVWKPEVGFPVAKLLTFAITNLLGEKSPGEQSSPNSEYFSNMGKGGWGRGKGGRYTLCIHLWQTELKPNEKGARFVMGQGGSRSKEVVGWGQALQGSPPRLSQASGTLLATLPQKVFCTGFDSHPHLCDCLIRPM